MPDTNNRPAPGKGDKPIKPLTKQEKSDELDEELDETFPASDPPASTQPGSGITGTEVRKEKR